MSLRAADVKNHALELYIQQALMRSQKYRRDQSERLSSRLDAISETDTQYAKQSESYQIPFHFRKETELTQTYQPEESPIKENMTKVKVDSTRTSPDRAFLTQSFNYQSPPRRPFNDSHSNIQFFQPSLDASSE